MTYDMAVPKVVFFKSLVSFRSPILFLTGQERCYLIILEKNPDPYPSPPSNTVGHERVELYLYSPYGPYGLYRASVPVQ
jgi:hypothetical protein